MKNYGETIRTIRLKKNMPQKVLYQDILSKSYAIRLEQGKHDISFYLLLKILARFPMEIDEFLYIHQNYQESETEWFYEEFSKRGNQTDSTALFSLKEHYLKTYTEHSADHPWKLQLDARLDQLVYYQETNKLTKDSVSLQTTTKIKQTLSSIQSWTIEDFRFFANTLDLLDSTDRVLYFQSILPAMDRYKNFEKARNVICVLLVNAIHELIEDFHIEGVPVLLTTLYDFSDKAHQMFFRNYYHFYLGLWQILINHPNGEKKARAAIELLKQMDYHYHTEILTLTLTRTLRQKETNSTD
ncbi:hypothetical protein [Enterococcus sp. DIV0197]|uniref:helix-turn-helix domain-containing protein n=1 Tax=unclassified Enterococcus TaxID=2608891 RepID=UPI003D27C61D